MLAIQMREPQRVRSYVAVNPNEPVHALEHRDVDVPSPVRPRHPR
jgi:hypothetical protein